LISVPSFMVLSNPTFLSRLPLRTRPPPRSTLFPYTTLFRSHVQYNRKRYNNSTQFYYDYFGSDISKLVSAIRAYRGLQGAHKKEDRKSTRLNSSHVSISYAVFCLKKKSKREQNAQAVYRSQE